MKTKPSSVGKAIIRFDSRLWKLSISHYEKIRYSLGLLYKVQYIKSFSIFLEDLVRIHSTDAATDNKRRHLTMCHYYETRYVLLTYLPVQ